MGLYELGVLGPSLLSILASELHASRLLGMIAGPDCIEEGEEVFKHCWETD